MKKFLLVVLLCAGCATHKPTVSRPVQQHTPNSAPVVVYTADNSAQELKALRAVTGQVTPQVTPKATVPTKITPEAPDVVPTDEAPPSPTVVHNSTPVHDAVNTVKTVKSQLIACMIAVFVGGILWITSLWAPLWLVLRKIVRKSLVWVKSKNVLNALETLAVEARSKIEVDFKDVEGSIGKSTPPVVPPPAPVVPPPAPVVPPPAVVTSESIIAAIHPNKI